MKRGCHVTATIQEVLRAKVLRDAPQVKKQHLPHTLLKRWRQSQGLRQEDCGMIFGVRKITYYSWESGHREPFSERIRQLIESVAGVPTTSWRTPSDSRQRASGSWTAKIGTAPVPVEEHNLPHDVEVVSELGITLRFTHIVEALRACRERHLGECTITRLADGKVLCRRVHKPTSWMFAVALEDQVR